MPASRPRRLLAALGLMLLAAPLPAAACHMTAGWEPYGNFLYRDEATGQAAGIDVDLVNLLAAEAGCTVTWTEMPWKRHLEELKRGTVGIATSTVRKPEREDFAHFSAPYRRESVAIFVRRGETARYALSSLADVPKIGFRLTRNRGYSHGPAFEAAMADPAFAAQVEESARYSENLQKLVNGRVDGLVGDAVVVLGEAKLAGLLDRIERYPLTLHEGPIHMMFSRASVDAATVARFDAALDRLQADGRYQAVFDKYTK